MKIISALLDLLFPPRATELVVRNTIDTKVYISQSISIIGKNISLSSYKDELVHACIVENKYHNNQQARALLSQLLSRWLQKEYNMTSIHLIPVPLGKKRLAERGYNQVTEILKGVASETSKIEETILIRHKNTVPQTTLPKSARLKNVSGVFTCSNESFLSSLRECVVMIVDDVLTTGATMNEARAALAPHIHPSVSLITVTIAH